jgi:hypothetical protein
MSAPYVYVLAALVILCVTAYVLKTKRFSLSADIWKGRFEVTMTSDEGPKSPKQTTPEP